MLTKVTIYGERCSGTNYLEQLLKTNFDIEIVFNYGHKHFFGFSNLSNNKDVLFIGIVRNIYDWINSFYREKHHLPTCLGTSEDTFLYDEFYSVEKDGSEIMNDRNIYTKERYKNIFELRHVKNKYLIEDLPNLVKNYILITYEDLIHEHDFIYTLYRIRACNLRIKDNIEFPLNIYYYKDLNHVIYENKTHLNTILNETILEKTNLKYEKILYPSLFT